MLPAGLTATAVVPASSANLGPGFDSLGLALSLYDDIVVDTTDSGLHGRRGRRRRGTSPARPCAPCGARHRAGVAGRRCDRSGIVRALPQRHSAFPRPGILGGRRGRWPGCGNGLVTQAGSTAFTESELIQLHRSSRATPTMRRPPSWAARWCPGQTAMAHPGTGRRGYGCTPISTCFLRHSRRTARRQPRPGCCSRAVSRHADARFNISRAALLVVALTERPDLLMQATEDVLHQPQRAAAMPASAEYLRILRRCGVAAVLSGAGPAVIARPKQELPAEVLEYGTANGFTVSEMAIGEGVRWTSGVGRSGS